MGNGGDGAQSLTLFDPAVQPVSLFTPLRVSCLRQYVLSCRNALADSVTPCNPRGDAMDRPPGAFLNPHS